MGMTDKQRTRLIWFGVSAALGLAVFAFALR